MHRIVVSKWLLDYAHGMDLEADYIPNGLNFDDFSVDVPLDRRNAKQLFVLYNWQACKGFDTGLKAILEAKKVIPDLEAAVFGWFPRPEMLPSWMDYYRRPSRRELRELYNQAAIFISSSEVEGWGLPPCEAAQCGAALCVTDIGGHREFAFHERTALLSPPGDSQALARNVIRLIQQPDLRIRLADNAHQFVQQFTWPKSVQALEKILLTGNQS